MHSLLRAGTPRHQPVFPVQNKETMPEPGEVHQNVEDQRREVSHTEESQEGNRVNEHVEENTEVGSVTAKQPSIIN